MTGRIAGQRRCPAQPRPEDDPVKIADYREVRRSVSEEAFKSATKAVIHYGGNRAYYAMDTDRIQMPPVEAFADVQSLQHTFS